MPTVASSYSRSRSPRAARILAGALLASAATFAHAGIDPGDRGERWWDASRADRIEFSDRAASECKSRNCDSLQIRSCLNETLKPPVPVALRKRTIAEVTATCIAGFRNKP